MVKVLGKKLDLPIKISDDLIEEVAEEYRAKCGRNDVLVHKRIRFTFEEFLALYLISPLICNLQPDPRVTA